MSELYLGLMSGTSADGIDAVLAEFEATRFVGLRASHHLDYESAFRRRLIDISLNQPKLSFREFATLDADIGEYFATAANQLLTAARVDPARVRAIGSHGQTVFHDGPAGLTLQLGDPNRIAEATGIATVADLRRRDLALGGQGAPLVPAFHHALFAKAGKRRCVLNIGGIANVTLLPGDDAAAVRGFDTGPGNGLLDEWIKRCLDQPYDAAGRFAASGTPHQPLISALLEDPFFALTPPKSTGRDYFRLQWLQRRFPDFGRLKPEDVQASLCEVTALSIAQAIRRNLSEPASVLVCGGGARNDFLMSRLRALLPDAAIGPTDDHGLAAEWIEAAAFAWLAMRTINSLPGNLPGVTGARAEAVLGGVYAARVR
ncbi:MAG: anhydro-N-acetylmuramic acid kinase [Nevskia sp.]